MNTTDNRPDVEIRQRLREHPDEHQLPIISNEALCRFGCGTFSTPDVRIVVRWADEHEKSSSHHLAKTERTRSQELPPEPTGDCIVRDKFGVAWVRHEDGVWFGRPGTTNWAALVRNGGIVYRREPSVEFTSALVHALAHRSPFVSANVDHYIVSKVELFHLVDEVLGRDSDA
jgi:hypothetical protein